MSHTAEIFDQALGEYLGFVNDPGATLAAALQADPAFILGHTTLAALNSLGGVPGHEQAVQGPLAAANALASRATRREKLHIAAANAWAADDIEGAAGLWEEALQDNPADLLSLRLAHDTHFFLGASQKLRDVPLAVLPAHAPGTRERGFVLGMVAFGLEEMGDYAAAEKAGREAVEINQADTWGVHAVAHVLEMQGRAQEGVGWLQGLASHWAPATGLAVHQWWHMGLFLIEEGGLHEALALYDTQLKAAPGAIVLDLVDGAALLWRLELLGVDVGQRWAELAPLWAAHATEHVLAFNDVHIAMSFSGMGDEAAADRLEASLASFAAQGHGTNARVSQTLGLPLIQALRAFRHGDYAGTVARLAPLYKALAPVGGSNAQRDVFIQTLGIAAIKTGDLALAQAITAERRKLKAGHPRAWAPYPALMV